METRLTLNSVFPSEIHSALKSLTVQQSIKAPLLVLNSDLDKQRAENLPQESKLIIVGVTKALSKLSSQQRSEWATLDSTLRQNPLLESPSDAELSFSAQLLKESNTFNPTNLLKNPTIRSFVESKPELASAMKNVEKAFQNVEKLAEDTGASNLKNFENTVTPEEVRAWFASLVKNSPLILDNLNPQFYTEILAYLGVHFPELLKKQSVPLLDLIILTYPSSGNSYFELAHVKVSGWAQESKDLMISKNRKMGITGDFVQKKFSPRMSILQGLKPETVAKADQEIPTLFVS